MIRLPRSSFARTFIQQAGATYATRLLGVLIGLITTIIISRALGPEGRGAFSSAMALAALGVQISNPGISSSNTYHAAKDPSLVPTLIGNSVVVAFAAGALTVVGILVAKLLGAFHALEGTLLFGTLVWIPLGCLYALLSAILLGERRIHQLNAWEMALRVVTTSAIALVVFVIGARTPEALFMAALAIQGAVGLGLLGALLRESGLRLHTSLGALLGQSSFAFKSYLTLLTSYMLVRLDLLMVQQISGNTEAGLYSIAVSVSDMLYILPSIIGQLLFPHLSSNDDPRQRIRVTFQMLLVVGVFMLVASAAVWILSPFLIQLLFGKEFLPTVPMLRVLLIAIVFYGMNGIVSNYFSAEGLPWPAVLVWFVALALNVMLNLLWIPHYGAVGASYASVAAYGLVLVLQIALMARNARAM